MKCSGLFTTCATENTALLNQILCIIENPSFDNFSNMQLFCAFVSLMKTRVDHGPLLKITEIL